MTAEQIFSTDEGVRFLDAALTLYEATMNGAEQSNLDELEEATATAWEVLVRCAMEQGLTEADVDSYLQEQAVAT